MKSRPFILSLLALTACALAAHGQSADKLPALDRADAWQVRTGDESKLQIRQPGGALQFLFNAAKDDEARVYLREPIAIPASAADFTFLGTAGAATTQLAVDLIIRDRTGAEFLYLSKQAFLNSYHGDVDVLNTGQLKGRTRRFSTPGLTRVDLKSNKTVIAPQPGRQPKGPLTLLGFCLRSQRQPHHTKDPIDLYFSNFAFTALSINNSTFAYQFNDTEMYGEIDGLPAVTLGDLGITGGTSRISWDVRDRYDGQPFLSGAKNIQIATDPQSPPTAVQLRERLEFPIQENGTYWIRVHTINQPTAKSVPQISTQEFRLFVIRGKPALTRTPIPAGKALENAAIRVAPGRASLVYSETEPFTVPIEFYKQSQTLTAPRATIRVITANLGTLKSEQTFQPQWNSADAPSICTLSLADLPPGAYRIQIKLADGSALIDQCEQLVGKKGSPVASQTIPASVRPWQEVLSSGRSFFHLSPMIHSQAKNRKDKNRWDFLKNFMEQAAPVSKDIEYAVPWSLLEPLPDVFDWEEADLMLACARDKGASVLFWPVAHEAPEWLPSDFARSKDGRIFYDFAYHFHGGRLNFSQSPALKSAHTGLFDAVAKRYRGNEALQGYFVLMELPGDAPFMGWIEGYDDITRQNFQRVVQSQPLAALNKRWGTTFKSYDQIGPPTDDASAAYWSDWMHFRGNGYDSVIYDAVKVLRQNDPRRVIWVYGDLVGSGLSFTDLKSMGCALANGGSHDAIHPLIYSQIGLADLVYRTEDHWPGKWTGYFPTVLDASVFSMSFAGGNAMNCKAYMFTWIPSEPEPLTLSTLRQPPYSFDRYEKFMPIWQELRHARRLPIDVRMLMDKQAFLTQSRTVYSGGYGDGFAQMLLYQSHLNFGGGDINLATQGKLLLLTKDFLEILSSSTVDKLVEYVQNGGTLLMRANAGRQIPEQPDQDWCLLKRFGFTPPEGAYKKDASSLVDPERGEIFPSSAGKFTLRGRWATINDPNSVAARYPDATPAITWRSVGKGKVAVLWSGTVVPPEFASTGGQYPFMRDIARWSGAHQALDCDSSKLWLNILQNPDNGNYYLLAHAGVWNSTPAPQNSGTVKLLMLPEKTSFRITEMISGATLGTKSQAELSTSGLSMTLKPREVMIYRLEPVRP